MEEKELEFDIAISFVGVDERIAVELNRLLKERFKTFLYTELEKQNAGAMFCSCGQKAERRRASFLAFRGYQRNSRPLDGPGGPAIADEPAKPTQQKERSGGKFP